MKYIVFTMDCISSKKMAHVTEFLEQRAESFNNNPLRNQRAVTDMKVLVGDEIQVVYEYNCEFIKYIRYLREAFFPIQLRIGMGIGVIDNPRSLELRDPWKLNGSAFHNARASLKYIENQAFLGSRGLSYLTSDNPVFDRIINNQVMLYDTLLERWSDKTYEAISLKEQYGSFRKLDGINGISSSAYTKRANAGNWAILELFESNIVKIIEEYNMGNNH